MRHWIGAFLAAGIAATSLMALDKPADEKGNDRASQFEILQKDFQKTINEVVKEFQAAKTSKERQAILDRLSKEYSPRVVKLVEADPKDKLSFEILLWGAENVPQIDTKVYDLLTEHWATNARIKSVCQAMSSQPSSATKLFRKVLEENPDKDAQGLACFALAKTALKKSESEGDPKAAEEAEKFYERVSRDFADVKAKRGAALGVQAKDALSEIRARGVGKTAPNVQSEDLAGKKVQLKDYKGKVVVLDIWATWCGPCRAMIPHERNMVKKLKDKPFALISVSADETKDTIKEFLDNESMPWTHWWNGPSGGILKDWNVQFFPTIYVLDAKGVIRYKHVRGDELEKAVEKLLAEVEK